MCTRHHCDSVDSFVTQVFCVDSRPIVYLSALPRFLHRQAWCLVSSVLEVAVVHDDACVRLDRVHPTNCAQQCHPSSYKGHLANLSATTYSQQHRQQECRCQVFTEYNSCSCHINVTSSAAASCIFVPTWPANNKEETYCSTGWVGLEPEGLVTLKTLLAV